MPPGTQKVNFAAKRQHIICLMILRNLIILEEEIDITQSLVCRSPVCLAVKLSKLSIYARIVFL